MRQMMDGPATLIQLIDEVIRLRGRLASLSFVDEGDPTGLSMTVLIAVVGAAQPPTVPQIGRSLGYGRQTIQRIADELTARGLILFIENPDHKRAQLLTPTDAGRAITQRADARGLEWAAGVVKDLDPERLKSAIDTLRDVRERLQADSRRRAASQTQAAR